MSLDEIRDKGHGSVDAAKEAFDELCAMVEALHVSLLQNLESVTFCLQKIFVEDLNARFYKIKLIFRLKERSEERLQLLGFKLEEHTT